jgi:hypothetical protein
MLMGAIPLLAGKPPASSGLWLGVISPFALGGTALFVWGLWPPMFPDERAHVKMRFLPSRFGTGLAIALLSCVIVYLFYNVVHIAPIGLLVAAFAGVPVGLITVGSSWTESCRGCGSPLTAVRGGTGFYCAGCRQLFVDRAGRTVVVGAEAQAVIEALAPKSVAGGSNSRAS